MDTRDNWRIRERLVAIDIVRRDKKAAIRLYDRSEDGETRTVNRRFAHPAATFLLSLQFFSFDEASEDGLRDLARANSFISDNRAPGKNL